MSDLPSAWFMVQLPHMIHPIIVRVSRRIGYFQPTMWESRGLPLGEVDAGWLVRTHSRCSPSKGGSNHWRPSNSYNVHFVITCKFRPIWKWSNTIMAPWRFAKPRHGFLPPWLMPMARINLFCNFVRWLPTTHIIARCPIKFVQPTMCCLMNFNTKLKAATLA